MPRINAFSRNMNSITLKIFPTNGGIEKFERNFWTEIKPWGVYRNIKGCILEANLEGQGC